MIIGVKIRCRIRSVGSVGKKIPIPAPLSKIIRRGIMDGYLVFFCV